MQWSDGLLVTWQTMQELIKTRHTGPTIESILALQGFRQWYCKVSAGHHRLGIRKVTMEMDIQCEKSDQSYQKEHFVQP